MSGEIFDARLGVLDTIRGILLDLADVDNAPEDDRPELVDRMGDVANLILEVLDFEVVEYQEGAGTLTATMKLEPL